MGLIRLIIYIILGMLIYRLVRPLLLKIFPSSQVRGGTSNPDDVQKKYKNRIEDADFEELE
jgi:hypothetical protein